LTALVKSNIAIFKLNNIHFKSFLKKYTRHTINDESFYRKTILNEHISKLKLYCSNKPIHLGFDETTDASGKSPALFKVFELTKTNSENVNCEILNF
jgi:hypothetical protein